MFFKVINNSIGSNRLVFILLVFGTYSRITKLDASFPSISQHTMATKKALDKVQKYTASQQINDTLNICNRTFTIFVHDLSINSIILVYQKKMLIN